MIFIGQKNEGNTRLSLYNPVKLQRYKQLMGAQFPLRLGSHYRKQWLQQKLVTA